MSLAALFAIATAGIVALAVAMDGSAQSQVQQREQVQQRTRERAGQREIIPGSELMTAKEREQYRQRLAAAATDAERDRLRAEHVKAMQERARLRGLQLADPIVTPGSGNK